MDGERDDLWVPGGRGSWCRERAGRGVVQHRQRGGCSRARPPLGPGPPKSGLGSGAGALGLGRPPGPDPSQVSPGQWGGCSRARSPQARIPPRSALGSGAGALGLGRPPPGPGSPQVSPGQRGGNRCTGVGPRDQRGAQWSRRDTGKAPSACRTVRPPRCAKHPVGRGVSCSPE